MVTHVLDTLDEERTQHPGVCLCGHLRGSSCLAARNYPGPTRRSLLCAASGKITVCLKRRKIKLFGQGGSGFDLSGFSASPRSLFLLDCSVHDRTPAALSDKKYKTRGKNSSTKRD